MIHIIFSFHVCLMVGQFCLSCTGQTNMESYLCTMTWKHLFMLILMDLGWMIFVALHQSAIKLLWRFDVIQYLGFWALFIRLYYTIYLFIKLRLLSINCKRHFKIQLDNSPDQIARIFCISPFKKDPIRLKLFSISPTNKTQLIKAKNGFTLKLLYVYLNNNE